MERKQQIYNTYRGIELGEGVKLYMKNGEFNKQVKEGLDVLADRLQERGHELLSEYVGNHVKILINFKCNHEPNWITPTHYKGGRGCPMCGIATRNKGRSKKSKGEFENSVKENGHEILTKYIRNDVKVLIDYKCGHEPHWISPNSYKSQGVGCPKCSASSNKGNRESRKEAKEDFIKLVRDNGHELLSDYKNNKAKVKMDYKCGHEPHWISPNSYKSQGVGCPSCSAIESNREKIDKSKAEFFDLIKENGHEWVDGEYVNSITKVLIDFKCGHGPHKISPTHYKRDRGCPKCSESKGEKIIREWLEKQGIVHKAQYIFPSLPNRKYDLYLPFDNLIVEVHGVQHYQFTKYYHITVGGFEQEQANDKVKREFAEALGYKYLVVDYREHNPQLTLERFREAYNKLKSESTVPLEE